jgi:hypothetical protein
VEKFPAVKNAGFATAGVVDEDVAAGDGEDMDFCCGEGSMRLRGESLREGFLAGVFVDVLAGDFVDVNASCMPADIHRDVLAGDFTDVFTKASCMPAAIHRPTRVTLRIAGLEYVRM